MQLMVIQDSDHLKIGNLDAQVGMELANGYKIVKVNNKSVIAEYRSHPEKFFEPTSIYYTEAAHWGFSYAALDKQVEDLSAIARKFNRGEALFQECYEHGYILPPENRIEQAGYEFAKEVQLMRKSAILKLKLFPKLSINE